MELELEIVSYHRLSPEQVCKKKFTGSATLGRAEKNDWYLPDPEKVVSGCHAKIENKDGDFYIHDTSTNGLYINRSVEALGQGTSHRLKTDDLLTFGDYEVKVISIEHVKTKVDNTPNIPPVAHEIDTMLSIKTNNDFQQTNKTQTPKFDGQINDDFSVPNASIPEEWDFGLIKDPNTTERLSSDVDLQQVSHEVASSPAKSDISINAPIERKQTNEHEKVGSLTSGDNYDLLKSFLNGIGCQNNIEKDLTSEMMFELGESLNLLLAGVMKTLRQRAEIKNDFRINQTTFQQTENNPLKFSASIDDVMQNLFLRRSSSFLSAKSAITEAFNDTQNHEKSLINGTQGAVEGLLKQLDPEHIAQRDFDGQNVLEKMIPNQKPAKYWKLYSLLHADIKHCLNKQQSQVWHDDFVAAYDKKIKSLA
ncbi:type VI secretion system-associated FHA domain protein TagH [Pseudoalteromonas sp. C2R02]|uniref:type VI secretion system-associated FHA domain protein TagH n=1 Tax=Pseudoalteromonas sp. C2R02 TaxID=2841565 RepID=UPI001C09285D|nr:type VI secretion system-associated FHA domain protein TagH [Pseudoalteromonas sp. C2R02]MBU2968417.1 type VI secretion system-associated FHA domain protein TagH [Pseudoalteromonas sp. C2R02]